MIIVILLVNWRRERDLNPRDPEEVTGFLSMKTQGLHFPQGNLRYSPLSHPGTIKK